MLHSFCLRVAWETALSPFDSFGSSQSGHIQQNESVAAEAGMAGPLTELLQERAKDATEFFLERAAIMEYDGGLSRPEAEREALRLTAIKFALNAC